MKNFLCAIGAMAALGMATPVAAEVGGAPPAAEVAAVSGCELHVWPTYNYVLDPDVKKDRVPALKEFMRIYLGPKIQMEELDKVGLTRSLGLPAETIIIAEDAMPSRDDWKNNKELKDKILFLEKLRSSGKRLTRSDSSCYSELIISQIFYSKSFAVFGNELFAYFSFRDFKDKLQVVSTSIGGVKNSLGSFPPEKPGDFAAAQRDLRLAFSNDFNEWLSKKKKP